MRFQSNATRSDERAKLFSGITNAIGLGLIGFAMLRPLTDIAHEKTGRTLLRGVQAFLYTPCRTIYCPCSKRRTAYDPL